MSSDAALRDLASERLDDFLPLLRRAFELGFREGMAATGAPPPVPQPPPAPAVAAAVLPFPAPADSGAEVEAEAPEEEEDDDDLRLEDAPAEADRPARPQYRGIRASATVSGLLKKIERVFRLEERFDLVVRVEDRKTGRALKRNVRLSYYLREDAASGR